MTLTPCSPACGAGPGELVQDSDVSLRGVQSPTPRSRMMRRHLATALAAFTVISCADAGPATAPSSITSGIAASARPIAALPDAGARGVTVMTRNLYLGADIFAVVEGDPRGIPLRVTQAWQHIQMMNFPERAGRIAEE